jgi:exodeoxyribonuclease V alpha subunit
MIGSLIMVEVWLNWLDRQLHRRGRSPLVQAVREELSQLWVAADQGSVARPVSSSMQKQLQSSGVLEITDPQVLVLEQDHLYLPQWWQLEMELWRLVDQRRMLPLVQDAPLPSSTTAVSLQASLDSDQARLLQVAMQKSLSFLTGGPGTGKTRTLVALLEQATKAYGADAIAVAAPTGKAASRLNEGLAAVGLALKAITVQRLLGFGRSAHSSLVPARLRHGAAAFNQHQPLPYRMVVVDEASMLGMSLARDLFAACSSRCNLVLAGDRDQLASVEPGNVFAQMVDALGAVRLNTNYRQANALALAGWAQEVRQGISVDAPFWQQAQLASDPGNWLAELRAGYGPVWEAMRSAVTRTLEPVDESPLDAIVEHAPWNRLLTRFKIVCGPRRGPLGVEALNRLCQQAFASYWTAHRMLAPRPEIVILRKNIVSLGLANGDVGVAMNHLVQPMVLFAQGHEYRWVLRASLPELEPAWALTVHQAQGSEFDEVLLILPDADSPLSTRELAYTGMTRAKDKLRISGSLQQWQAAVARPTRRDGLLGVRLMRPA